MEKYINIFKVFTIVILLFATSIEAKSQVYKEYKKIHKMYKNLHIADSLYETKDYNKAIKFYKKSKDAYCYEFMVLSLIADCYLMLGDSTKAEEYSKKIQEPKVEVNINEELRAEFLKRKITDQMRGSANNDSLWKIQKEYDKDNQRF